MKSNKKIESINNFLKKNECYFNFNYKKYGINYSQLELNYEDIPDDIVFLVPEYGDLHFFVIEKYFFNSADYIEQIENILINDTTKNIKLHFNYNQEYEIYYIYRTYYYKNDISINGFLLSDILQYISELDNEELLKLHNFSDELKKTCKELCKQFHMNEKELLIFLFNKYAKELLVYKALLMNYISDYEKNIPYLIKMQFWEIYYDYLMDMLKITKSQIKRTTELIYLKIIRDYFPNAIYQYRDKIFGRQSIDIYIPDKRIAFEIQGEQHFKPIDFFGGEEQFQKQQKLDDRKRKICELNNIKLYNISDINDKSIYEILEEIKKGNNN